MTHGRFKATFALLFVMLFIGVIGCNKQKPQGSAVTINVAENEKVLRYFADKNPGREVIRASKSDLNSDGRDDLVVIYNVSKGKNKMRVVLDLKDGCKQTNEVPAPVSKQRIKLKNIDDKPPMEFIVQGAKGIYVGYAIYRIEGLKLIDIFGEGMEDCC